MMKKRREARLEKEMWPGNSHKLTPFGRWLGVLILLLGLSGCADAAVTPSALDPQGPAAAQIANLWWWMLSLGTLTYLLVMGVLLVALGGRSSPISENQRRWLVGSGMFFTAVILLVVFGFTLNTLNALNLDKASTPLVIEVEGVQWWWRVRYPDQQIETANEIHIPVDTPVQLKLTSGDVIHSFWVPELHGKKDLIPGKTNSWWLEAEEAGEYWGLCAEFCGTQHAKMLFVVIAEPEAEFNEWLTQQQQPAQTPPSELARFGQQLFMEKSCSECHAVKGTEAVGDLGPDLTHFASRMTLGSAIAPNDRAQLAAWILNPHTIKPGNLMPATELTENELEALLAYMESLE